LKKDFINIVNIFFLNRKGARAQGSFEKGTLIIMIDYVNCVELIFQLCHHNQSAQSAFLLSSLRPRVFAVKCLQFSQSFPKQQLPNTTRRR
jgi:hypothetical protein